MITVKTFDRIDVEALGYIDTTTTLRESSFVEDEIFIVYRTDPNNANQTRGGFLTRSQVAEIVFGGWRK